MHVGGPRRSTALEWREHGLPFQQGLVDDMLFMPCFCSRTLTTSSKSVIQLPRLGELDYDESVMRSCRQLADSAVAQSAHTDSETRYAGSQDDLPLSLSRGRWAIEGQG